MTISLRWAEDINNVLVWQFSSDWAWKEVFETRPVSDEMITSQQGRVDLILMTSATTIPAGAFDHMDKLAQLDLPDNAGLLVVVNSASAIQTMIKISSKLNAADYWKLADSYDNAKRLIEADREKSAPDNEHNHGDTP